MAILHSGRRQTESARLEKQMTQSEESMRKPYGYAGDPPAPSPAGIVFLPRAFSSAVVNFFTSCAR